MALRWSSATASRARFARAAGVAVMVSSMFFGAASVRAAEDPAWAAFRAKFVMAEGRVVDFEDKKVSHTEGQGYGMLLAVANDDRKTFDALWNWTKANLSRKDDYLFSWAWRPDDKPHVKDKNDATDGDILIAWALLRAGQKWEVPEFVSASRDIRGSIRDKLVKVIAGRTVLLPGAAGFHNKDQTEISLSYYIFPAFNEFAKDEPQGGWDKLAHDGVELILDARYGRYVLSPDWIEISGKGELRIATQWPAQFGFGSVRVPLYLVWGGVSSMDIIGPYVNFWRGMAMQDKAPPGWVDLYTGAYAPFEAPLGIRAIAAFVSGTPNVTMLGYSDKEPYYSAVLFLLSQLAYRETMQAKLTPQ
ncbi:MAG: glycosyl hydrolase family 8 [Parvibaculaceae bacterium]|nr:glycosyl hydrolase family 8 [Parvibaculaceae bacterium]